VTVKARASQVEGKLSQNLVSFAMAFSGSRDSMSFDYRVLALDSGSIDIRGDPNPFKGKCIQYNRSDGAVREMLFAPLVLSKHDTLFRESALRFIEKLGSVTRSPQPESLERSYCVMLETIPDQAGAAQAVSPRSGPSPESPITPRATTPYWMTWQEKLALFCYIVFVDGRCMWSNEANAPSIIRTTMYMCRFASVDGSPAFHHTMRSKEAVYSIGRPLMEMDAFYARIKLGPMRSPDAISTVAESCMRCMLLMWTLFAYSCARKYNKMRWSCLGLVRLAFSVHDGDYRTSGAYTTAMKYMKEREPHQMQSLNTFVRSTPSLSKFARHGSEHGAASSELDAIYNVCEAIRQINVQTQYTKVPAGRIFAHPVQWVNRSALLEILYSIGDFAVIHRIFESGPSEHFPGAEMRYALVPRHLGVRVRSMLRYIDERLVHAYDVYDSRTTETSVLVAMPNHHFAYVNMLVAARSVTNGDACIRTVNGEGVLPILLAAINPFGMERAKDFKSRSASWLPPFMSILRCFVVDRLDREPSEALPWITEMIMNLIAFISSPAVHDIRRRMVLESSDWIGACLLTWLCIPFAANVCVCKENLALFEKVEANYAKYSKVAQTPDLFSDLRQKRAASLSSAASAASAESPPPPKLSHPRRFCRDRAPPADATILSAKRIRAMCMFLQSVMYAKDLREFFTEEIFTVVAALSVQLHIKSNDAAQRFPSSMPRGVDPQKWTRPSEPSGCSKPGAKIAYDGDRVFIQSIARLCGARDPHELDGAGECYTAQNCVPATLFDDKGLATNMFLPVHLHSGELVHPLVHSVLNELYDLAPLEAFDVPDSKLPWTFDAASSPALTSPNRRSAGSMVLPQPSPVSNGHLASTSNRDRINARQSHAEFPELQLHFEKSDDEADIGSVRNGAKMMRATSENDR
jgi:hypothetical protein